MSGKPFKLSKSKKRRWKKRMDEKIRRHKEFMKTKPRIHVPYKSYRKPEMDWL